MSKMAFPPFCYEIFHFLNSWYTKSVSLLLGRITVICAISLSQPSTTARSNNSPSLICLSSRERITKLNFLPTRPYNFTSRRFGEDCQRIVYIIDAHNCQRNCSYSVDFSLPTPFNCFSLI